MFYVNNSNPFETIYTVRREKRNHVFSIIRSYTINEPTVIR